MSAGRVRFFVCHNLSVIFRINCFFSRVVFCNFPGLFSIHLKGRLSICIIFVFRSSADSSKFRSHEAQFWVSFQLFDLPCRWYQYYRTCHAHSPLKCWCLASLMTIFNSSEKHFMLWELPRHDHFIRGFVLNFCFLLPSMTVWSCIVQVQMKLEKDYRYCLAAEH